MAISKRKSPASTPSTWNTSGIRKGLPKLFLVESNNSARMALEALLSDFAYRTVAFASLDDALATAEQSRPPDLLVTEGQPRDRHRGLIASFQVCYPRTAIIVMSTLHEPSMNPGVHYLMKPVHFDELLALIHAALASRASREA